jgi:hypothetical protein
MAFPWLKSIDDTALFIHTYGMKRELSISKNTYGGWSGCAIMQQVNLHM